MYSTTHFSALGLSLLITGCLGSGKADDDGRSDGDGDAADGSDGDDLGVDLVEDGAYIDGWTGGAIFDSNGDICRARWEMSGPQVTCADCDYAFAVDLTVSDDNCGFVDDRQGIFEISGNHAYFDGGYWGYLIYSGSGFLYWMSIYTVDSDIYDVYQYYGEARY